MQIRNFSYLKNIIKASEKRFVSKPAVKSFINFDQFGTDIYKAKCVKALQGEKPFELAVLLDKKTGKFLSEFKGDASGCFVDLPKTSSSMVLLHGHPTIDGTTLPVSLKDFELMNNSKIDKIVAFNKNGQESFLQKKQNFIPLNNSEFTNLKSGFIRHLVNNAPKEECSRFNSLFKRCIKDKNAALLKQELADSLSALQLKSAESIDSFWRQNASKYNLEYFSNFS